MSLTKKIKEYGQYLGYSRVGVTTADDFDEYMDTLNSRENCEFILKYKLITSKPREMMPSAQSIIVLMLDYKQNSLPENLDNMIGSVYLSRSYSPQPHSIHGARLQLMMDYLKESGCQVREDIPVPARWAAARAGIATIGKNNFAYADGLGSYMTIYTLVIDKELEYDRPSMENKCPPDCTKCRDACPTQALVEPFHLDPVRCIAYNNWVAKDVPLELRGKMGTRIHGCDICQQVCPRNNLKNKQVLPKDEYLEVLARDLTLPAILNMDDNFFQTRIKPIMYNYISKPKMFRRNAIIAMGNSGDKDYIPSLEVVLEDEDEMLKEYAIWALNQLKEKAIETDEIK